MLNCITLEFILIISSKPNILIQCSVIGYLWIGLASIINTANRSLQKLAWQDNREYGITPCSLQ